MDKLITKFFSTTSSVVKKGMAAMLCMGLFWGVGCKKNNPISGTEPDTEISLKGTKWKLVGIMDMLIGELTELEPEDCEDCYTIAFDNIDDFFEGKAVEVVFLSPCYTVNYTFSTIQFPMGIERPDADDIYDGNLYLEIWSFNFREVQPFELRDSELKLYYNDKRNYLLFNKLK